MPETAVTETKRPVDVAEYVEWMAEDLDVEISRTMEAHYLAVTTSMKAKFEQSGIWKDLVGTRDWLEHGRSVETAIQARYRLSAGRFVILPFPLGVEPDRGHAALSSYPDMGFRVRLEWMADG